MRFPLCIVALVAVAMTGCGGEPEAQTRTQAKPRAHHSSQKFNQKRVEADFEAMTLADDAGSAVYRCMTRTGKFERCNGPVIDGIEFKLGEHPGEIEVKKPIDTDYAVSAHSTTGSLFSSLGSVDGIVPDHACRARHRDGGCRQGIWFRPHLKLARGDHRGQDDQVHRFMGTLAVRLQLCAGVDGSYARCTRPKKLAEYADTTIIQPPLPFGHRRGQVELRNVRRNSFEIVGHSESGNEFVMAGAARRDWVRRCRAAVADGRCRGGRW